MTHVALNLVFLVPGETGGMEVAARALVEALAEHAPPDMRFTALINREAAEAGGGPWGDLVPARVVPVRSRSRVQWVLGEQLHVPRFAESLGADIVHSLASTAPLHGRFRRVTTIHDLIYLHHPEAHAGVLALGLKALLPACAHRSHRIIAVSEATKADVVRSFRVAPEKVDVVPQAGGGGAGAGVAALGEEELRRRLDLGSAPILLTVSAKRPHKNLVRLLEAHARLEAPRPLLVLPGYATWHEDELRARAAELGTAGDVRFFGWLAPEELEGLYAAATAFVFPSLYEGFGMPVLEAMARGVPVAAADRSSLPEVAGGAALLFDPFSVDELAGALRRLLSDEALRHRLRAAGRERAAQFTWERTARGVLEAYRLSLR